MQIRKTTRNWAIASAVAAMLAASTTVQAQTTTPDPNAAAPSTTAPAAPMTPATPDTSAAAPMAPSTMPAPMAPGAMSSAPMMGAIDYSILSNPNYDYIDLQQAKARGLSDNQIATIAKIAKETGFGFRTVSAAVERGETFPALAAQYNLKLADVYEADKEKQEVADYITAYESISPKAMSSGSPMMMTPMSGPGMAAAPMTPAPMSSTPMTPPAPMSTPPMTTPAMSANTATLDIVDTAMAAKNLTTLVKALQVAGLVETLKGAGPFTVFAPDDKAFSRLPAGTLDALLADPAKLKTILTYHVIPAAIMAADAKNMSSPTSPPTVEGATLQVTKGRRGRLKVNDATVIKADIQATNGVIHIIDRVLMPPDTSATDTSGAPMTTGTATTTSPAPDATAAPNNTPSAATQGTTPGTPQGATPAPTATTPATPATP